MANKQIALVINLNQMIVFCLLVIQLAVFISCDPNIKFALLRSSDETAEQVALIPRIRAYADYYGGYEVEDYSLPSKDYYASETDEGRSLHYSWFNIEITRKLMAENPEIPWILTIQLSALPTDGSAAIDFAALIVGNPSVSVFFKRIEGITKMSLYKNDKATNDVLTSIWGKRSEKGTLTAAFTSFTFWNPLIVSKVKFL